MTEKQKTNSGKKRQKRVGSLKTRGLILSEMGRLYREARRGEIPWMEAKGLASVLIGAAQVMRDAEAETIVAEIARLRAELSGANDNGDTLSEPELIPPPIKQIASR